MNTVRNLGKFLLGIVLGALLVLAAEILLIKIWDFSTIRFGVIWFSDDFGIQSLINLCLLLFMGGRGYRMVKRRDVLLAEGFISGCIISISVLAYIIFYFYNFWWFT